MKYRPMLCGLPMPTKIAQWATELRCWVLTLNLSITLINNTNNTKLKTDPNPNNDRVIKRKK